MLLISEMGPAKGVHFRAPSSLLSHEQAIRKIKGEDLVVWDCQENRNSHKKEGTYWDFLSSHIGASAQGALAVYFLVDLGSYSSISLRERQIRPGLRTRAPPSITLSSSFFPWLAPSLSLGLGSRGFASNNPSPANLETSLSHTHHTVQHSSLSNYVFCLFVVCPSIRQSDLVSIFIQGLAHHICLMHIYGEWMNKSQKECFKQVRSPESKWKHL